MENYNEIFNRKDTEDKIKKILMDFDEKSNELSFKKGIYIYGSPGSGKTYFITKILQDLKYDIIKYDAGDIRNKSLIDTITSNNVSSKNVLDLMTKKQKKIAIIMDEIDGMNSGDKGGINALIKLIRQKKTKKQKLEGKTMNPIICIGNYYTDKKMRELMKVCNIFELKTPLPCEIKNILQYKIPKFKDLSNKHIELILTYIQGDLRKLNFVINILESEKANFQLPETFIPIFETKNFNEDSKQTTNQLLENNYDISLHNSLINETDRTIIALLWHENIIDKLQQIPISISLPIYIKK